MIYLCISLFCLYAYSYRYKQHSACLALPFLLLIPIKVLRDYLISMSEAKKIRVNPPQLIFIIASTVRDLTELELTPSYI